MQDIAQFVQMAQTLCYDLARAEKATDGKRKKCGETQIWMGDLRVALVWFLCVFLAFGTDLLFSRTTRVLLSQIFTLMQL